MQRMTLRAAADAEHSAGRVTYLAGVFDGDGV
jgi:hypothetical protein